jgi:phosphate uptake regulator
MATNEAREIAMYGCTVESMRADMEDSISAKLSGMGMVAMSILSDSQEEIQHGQPEAARQSINRAKWVIRTYWIEPTR